MIGLYSSTNTNTVEPQQNQVEFVLASFPREEEEKGPGFSHSHMRLIVVDFHHLCILLIYFHTLVTPILTLNVTLSVDLWQQRMACSKKLTWLYSFSGRFEAINTQWELPWSQLTRRKGYLPAKLSQKVNLGFHYASVCSFCWRTSLINSARLLAKALR